MKQEEMNKPEITGYQFASIAAWVDHKGPYYAKTGARRMAKDVARGSEQYKAGLEAFLHDGALLGALYLEDQAYADNLAKAQAAAAVEAQVRTDESERARYRGPIEGLFSGSPARIERDLNEGCDYLRPDDEHAILFAPAGSPAIKLQKAWDLPTTLTWESGGARYWMFNRSGTNIHSIRGNAFGAICAEKYPGKLERSEVARSRFSDVAWVTKPKNALPTDGPAKLPRFPSKGSDLMIAASGAHPDLFDRLLS